MKQIELFLSQGWITDFASVFQLATHADEMLILEGYKQKSVANLIESLEKARHTTLDRVLTAIGIPNVGKKTAKTIAKHVLEKIHLVSVMSSEAIAESRYLALENTEQDFSASPAQRDSIEMTEQQRYLLDSLFSTTPEELLEIKDI